MKNWFNGFYYRGQSLKDAVREGSHKTAVVSENIDAVRRLIMQDRHVTYREIELSLGISPTNIQHSILNEHLAVKTFVFAESAIAQKSLLSIGA